MSWVAVCGVDEIAPATAACALLHGQQVALVRFGDQVFALDNLDPFSGAFVIARGIVGDAGGVPKIASPMHQQTFDLRTGRCLDDPTRALRVWPCRVRDRGVEVLLEEDR